MNRIKILEQNHEFQEVISYYEEKIDDLNRKNENNIKMFAKLINTFSTTNVNVNKN